jgi:hypothetical protein
MMTTIQTLILQGVGASRHVTHEALLEMVQQCPYSEFTVVSPFLTEDGVRLLLEIADAGKVELVRWIVGLDGVVTTPAGLRLVLQDTRTAKPAAWLQWEPIPALHSKLYCLKNNKPFRIALYVGSANATGAGLKTNVEIGTIIRAIGKKAREIDTELNNFLNQLALSSAMVELNTDLVNRYQKRFKPFRGRHALPKILGVMSFTKPLRLVVPSVAWIEIAVRGGSSNQLEICGHMSMFFRQNDKETRRDIRLIDRRSGKLFSGNAYRFRHGNFGHRIEFNTTLSRDLQLLGAAQKRDLVRFEKSTSPDTYIVDVIPATSKIAKSLRKKAKLANRLYRTIPGKGGRDYYIDLPAGQV